MTSRVFQAACVALLLCATAPGPALAQGYNGYPYSIMTPEPGTASRSATAPQRRHGAVSRGRVRQFAARPAQGNRLAARGSSGSVLPTPLPRTPLIPPEGGGGVRTVPALPREQGPTVVPGVGNIPNLPHGAETFQDRASRCAFQQGLYNVPGTAGTQYMGACVQ